MAKSGNFTKSAVVAMTAIAAAAVAAHAAYLALQLPPGLQFEVSYITPGRDRGLMVGLWGLFIFPALLAGLAIYLARSTEMDPKPDGSPQRLLAVLAVGVVAGIVTAQMILTGYAIDAAAAAG